MTVVDGISETDVHVAVAVLARRFPNTVVWFGESTRQCGRSCGVAGGTSSKRLPPKS